MFRDQTYYGNQMLQSPLSQFQLHKVERAAHVAVCVYILSLYSVMQVWSSVYTELVLFHPDTEGRYTFPRADQVLAHIMDAACCHV